MDSVILFVDFLNIVIIGPRTPTLCLPCCYLDAVMLSIRKGEVDASSRTHITIFVEVIFVLC